MDDGQTRSGYAFYSTFAYPLPAKRRSRSWELGVGLNLLGAEPRVLDTSKRSENRSALLQKRWQCMSWEWVSLRNKKAKYRVFIQVFLSVFPNILVPTEAIRLAEK